MAQPSQTSLHSLAMNRSTLLCGMCAKVVQLRGALIFDKTNSTLQSGVCVCLFHVDCAALLQQDDRKYHCDTCTTYTDNLRKLTDHNCLCCGAYTSEVVCCICLQSTLHALHNQALQAAVDLYTFAENLLVRKLTELQLDFKPAFIAWFLEQLRVATTAVLLYSDGRLFAWSERNLMCHLWKQLLLKDQTAIDAQEWVRYHQGSPLALFLRLSPAQVNDSLQHMETYLPYTTIRKGVLTGPAHAGDFGSTTNNRNKLWLGKQLVAAGRLQYYEQLVEEGSWKQLFLVHVNDWLFYPAVELSTLNYMHSCEPGFFSAWLTLLRQS